MAHMIRVLVPYFASLAITIAAVSATFYSPLYDHSTMFLPFTAVILSAIWFGRGAMLFSALIAIVAHDYYFVGPVQALEFSWLYVIESTVFLIIGYFLYGVLEARRKAEEELARIKDEFLFMTAHDLRSPLQVIRVLLETHKLSTPGADAQFQRDLSQIDKEFERITALVSRLDQLGRSESPFQERTRIDLSKVMRGIIRGWEKVASQRGIRISYIGADAPAILGDETAIREIFDNLIGNAVKYNREHGEVEVRHEISADSVTTSVRDTGVGIAEEDLANVFVPYFRSARVKGTQGTGLGLYIVDKLVRKQGGSIRVSSSLGAGTTFSVTLPKFPSAHFQG